MKTFVVLALLCAFGAVHAYEMDGEVYQLTDDDFDEFIEDNPVALVKFFAPWCGHCKSLAPKYKEAAKILKDQGIEAVMAEVDATEQKNQAGKYGVRGYPTLKVFLNGQPMDYNGAREAAALVDTLKKYTGPAVEVFEDKESAKAFMESEGVKVFGVFFDDDNKNIKLFTKIAEESRAESYVFGAAYSPDLVDMEAGIYVMIAGEDSEALLLEAKGTKMHKKEVVDFIQKESVPLVDELGPDNYQKYKQRGLPLVFAFVDSEEDNTDFLNVLRTVGKTVKGEISVTYLDGKKYGQQATRLALSGEVFPCLAVEDSSDMHFAYPEDEPLEAEPLEAFFKGILSGNVEPTIKSEEIPETQDEPVYRLVSKAFDDVVYGQNKDVFVKFYAPWCGHCKKLAPIWEKMATQLNVVDSIIIADFDATTNDPPKGANVRGFPTLIFYPAGSKAGAPGITYKGERELEDLIEFVEENAAIPFEEPAEGYEEAAAAAAAEEVI